MKGHKLHIFQVDYQYNQILIYEDRLLFYCLYVTFLKDAGDSKKLLHSVVAHFFTTFFNKSQCVVSMFKNRDSTMSQ